MGIKLEYDHSHLNITYLHKIGIRSTKEIEYVIEDRFSFCEEGSDVFEFSVFIFTGLNSNCRGLKVALTISDEGKFVTLGVEIPSNEELIIKLCRLLK